MSDDQKAEEIRWRIIKAMLEDFPQLRTRVKEHLDSVPKQYRKGSASNPPPSTPRSEAYLSSQPTRCRRSVLNPLLKIALLQMKL